MKPMSAPHPTKLQVFAAFLAIGASSFGGAQPWAWHKLVEQKAWLTNDEFTEALALGQMLPGPNVVNLSVMVGRRFQGLPGAFLALGGLLLVPVVIVFLLAVLYGAYGALPLVRQAFAGIAAATAGLVAAMGVKMLMKQPRSWGAGALTALAFIGSAVLRWPLWSVLLTLLPLGLVLAWRKERA